MGSRTIGVEEVPAEEATLAVAEVISVVATTLVVETGRASNATTSPGPLRTAMSAKPSLPCISGSPVYSFFVVSHQSFGRKLV